MGSPATTEVMASSILTPQKVGSLSPYYDFSLNPYAGCAFSCSYCYVPKFPNAHGRDYKQWGSWVEVKVNAPELIQRDRTRVFGSRIFFSSATDPYQYLELKYRLSRRCLEQLLCYKPAKVTMHTRSHLILQDLALLQAFGKTLSVGVSLTTDIESVRREFEPGAPSVQRRLQLIAALRDAGVDVYISMAPLLPCDPERFARLIAPYVDRVWADTMRWTEVNTKPELIKKYAAHFDPENHSKTIAKLKRLFADERLRLKRDELANQPASQKASQVQTKRDALAKRNAASGPSPAGSRPRPTETGAAERGGKGDHEHRQLKLAL